MKWLIHVDLFAGIAGFTLAAEEAGFETILFVEKDQYCQKVLRKHYPAVPIVEDIRDVEKIKEIVANCNTARQPNRDEEYRGQQTQKGKGQHSSSRCGIGINSTGSRTATTNQPVTLITGGFPCQPFSVAGKRGGTADDRYLWPEMFTIIKEVRPTWCLIENVAGIVGMVEQYRDFRVEGRSVIRTEEEDIFKGLYTRQEIMLLNTLRKDLEGEGFETLWLIIPACAVNAPHRRDRVWVIANATRERLYNKANKSKLARAGSNELLPIKSGNTEDVANSLSTEGGSEGRRLTSRAKDEGRRATENGRETIRSGAEAPFSSQSRQAGDIVPNTESRDTRQQTEQEGGEDTSRGSEEVAITDTQQMGWSKGTNQGQAKPEQQHNNRRWNQVGNVPSNEGWWAVESRLGRVVDGLSYRMDGHYFDREPNIPRITTRRKYRKERLSCLGNAVVPQVAYQILKIIAEMER